MPSAKKLPHKNFLTGRLTREVADALLEAAGKGMHPSVAAAYANIRPSLLSDWLKRGEAELDHPEMSPYARLKLAWDYHLAKWEAERQGRVAGADDWKADAWLLERRFPDRWGKQLPDGLVAGSGQVEVVFVNTMEGTLERRRQQTEETIQ